MLEKRKEKLLSILRWPNLSFSFNFSEICWPCPPHMVHLCSGVSHRDSIPFNLFVLHRSTFMLLVESKMRISYQILVKSKRHWKQYTGTNTPYAHISCFRICVICYKPISPAVEPGLKFRSWPFTLLSCDFLRQQANKLQWRVNAAKAPMKPGTVVKEFSWWTSVQY